MNATTLNRINETWTMIPKVHDIGLSDLPQGYSSCLQNWRKVHTYCVVSWATLGELHTVSSPDFVGIQSAIFGIGVVIQMLVDSLRNTNHSGLPYI
jgi:hypothetical protein